MTKHKLYEKHSKVKVMLEALKEQKIATDLLCREYGTELDLLTHWKASFLERGSHGFESEYNAWRSGS